LSREIHTRLKAEDSQKEDKELRKRIHGGKTLYLNFIIFDDKHESDTTDLEASMMQANSN
jgi:hypothetical protein